MRMKRSKNQKERIEEEINGVSEFIEQRKTAIKEAEALVKKYDGEFPKKYFSEFLKYVDITENDFWKIIDSARSEHLWQRAPDGTWVLSHQVT